MKTLGDELRWTFTWPFGWLQGVLVNLVLAAAYLVFWPLAVNDQYDIVLLFSVYFATFIMADVTTTNIFGHDIVRMLRALDQGRSFLSLMLLKNLVQTIVVVIPMLLITVGVTYAVRGLGELVLAIPGILYPMLLWLGVGNVISVVFPVIPAPIQWRIQSVRQGVHHWKLHAPLVISYVVPWVIYAITSYTDIPGNLNALIREFAGMPHKWESGLILLVFSSVLYVFFTWLSVAIVRHYGFALRMQDQLVREAPLDQQMHIAAARLLPGN
ncbi:hypothetical protein [Corynebacterium freiburgense]|uniref:hypothetical protein n=1 Tax=Corynebacterium freiburgense TaxID=556548 RepID=UPI00042499DF|nr:hypothetical protein [Corynebacterium freiburgense]WJZ03069.1 hypothetical protein CFREI_08955 [Corynebacterium freiburgense]